MITVKKMTFFALLLLIDKVHPIPSDYWTKRMQLLQCEEAGSFGGDLALGPSERLANDYLMLAKNYEINNAMDNANEFLPSRNFLTVIDKVEDSEVFRIIREMPKGAILHVHDIAITSNQFLYNATFRNNVYVCDGQDIKLRFFDKPNSECDWKLLEDVRKNETYANDLNKRIMNSMTMTCDNPDERYPNGDAAWTKFISIFEFIKPLISHRPVYEDYIYAGLSEMYKDNVMYVEVRSILPSLYDLDGTVLSTVESIQLYKDVIKRFTKDHPDFIGAKLIYAPNRSADLVKFEEYKNTLTTIRQAHGDFITGFDLVGQEDKGNSLAYFVNMMLEIDPSINFYFHAGETNWFGSAVDENLIDAVLLGAKRIGHGYALLKHPKVMEEMRRRDIALEVNPISNQVLGLVRDMRNHPASLLFAQNFPLVISNDDPGLLGTRALSYDFYEAFMGIMSRHSDLRALKKLALNSIKYSSMDEQQRTRANKLFKDKWDLFVETLNYRSERKVILRH